MSDEPQPKQDRQGWAPREPEPGPTRRRAPQVEPGTGQGRSGADGPATAPGGPGEASEEAGPEAASGSPREGSRASGPEAASGSPREGSRASGSRAGSNNPGEGSGGSGAASGGAGGAPGVAGPAPRGSEGRGEGSDGASAEGSGDAPDSESTAPSAPQRGTAPGKAASLDDSTRRLRAVAADTASGVASAGGPVRGNTPGAPLDDSTRQLRPVTTDNGPRTTPTPTPAPAPDDGPVTAPLPTPAGGAAVGTAAVGATADPTGSGKKAKRVKRKRTGWRRLLPTWRMVLGTFVFGTLLLIGLLVLGYNLVKIPAANAAATKQSNVFLYADGSQLARDGEVNRENVSLAQISKPAQHAVLAAEDRDFYGESAIDPKAMLRAAWNTATGKGKQSGSTITQQYVKNYYLAQEQTVTRKVKEFFISIKLDREVSKDHILEGYLNTSFFGRNAYGIQAAAQAYYGVDADELTPGQGAYLASLLNAPSEYDVVAHPENKAAAVARWEYVLDGMVKEGWLSESARAKTTFPTPKQTVVSAGMSGQRGYLVEAVKQYLYENKIINEDTLRAGGYRITTTLQKSKQDDFVKAVDDQVMEKLDKKNRKVDNYVRVGGVSIDPKTGKVLAMYGGIDFTKQYYNNATRRDFQVGSTFKPFVFTSAVQNGSATQNGTPITPNTIYDGTNVRPVQGWSGGAYAPENEDQVNYGDITVRQATDKSVNSVYAQMAVDVGPQRVERTAIDLGLPESTPDMEPYPSIALGTATASVLDMAEAYATLANHGKHGTYTLVNKITKDGEEIGLPKQNVRQAVTREAADTTTSVLQSVVESGTATAAQAAGRPAAGKTGTAEEDKAAWFAGYTPDLATVVAVMGQDPVSGEHKPLYGAMGLPRINGGGAPAEIWAQFTKAALEGTRVTDFDLELQEGADQVVIPPSAPAEEPSTPGEEGDGGATTGGDTGGQTGGTPGTDGGTETGGGTTDGGTTDGGTPGTPGTPGPPTAGGTADGGTTDGSTTQGGGGSADGGTGDGGTTTGALSFGG